MNDIDSDPRVERLQRERDLCLRLLSLGDCEGVESFLKEALELIVEVTAAEVGYLELIDPDETTGSVWCLGHGCSDVDVHEIQNRMSRGIIAEAIGSGATIQTDLAMSDIRFNMRESVRVGKIEAVLCAPIGGDAALGVVYLQSKPGAVPFIESDRRLTELFAVHLAPLSDRLLMRRRISETGDATRALRQKYQLSGIVGRSKSLADVLEQAMLAAPLEINVLLTGSSGTGKSQLARAIHANSRRSDGPFVELNCAALPDTLIESELFGALAGSHSEAKSDRLGKVGAAEAGTLFLDEIGELPIQAQAKLLQLLHSREYYPLGATRPSFANVRVIAATNADLEEAMRENRFRPDLFYRLQVLPLRLPDLTERRDDLPELARFLLERACKEHGIPEMMLSRSSLLAIEATEWPGNIRELQNSIEAAAVRALGSQSADLEVVHLFPDRENAVEASVLQGGRALTFQEATRDFQRRLIAQALEDSDWNVTEVARRLDLARSHVYNLIKALGLERTPR